jgi:hypothetical protein
MVKPIEGDTIFEIVYEENPVEGNPNFEFVIEDCPHGIDKPAGCVCNCPPTKIVRDLAAKPIVTCDETNNTPETMSLHEILVTIGIPVKRYEGEEP